ncbi:hypothetical protein M2360_005360, partial [Rhizobium sp. SG_E_25_P2]|nr:hypothetical protein [Rhizobium sp. SG_E_25_P2]
FDRVVSFGCPVTVLAVGSLTLLVKKKERRGRRMSVGISGFRP